MAPQTLAEKAKAKLQAVLEDPNRNDSSCMCLSLDVFNFDHY